MWETMFCVMRHIELVFGDKSGFANGSWWVLENKFKSINKPFLIVVENIPQVSDCLLLNFLYAWKNL